MDALGIQTSVLSLTPTLFFYWLDAAAAGDFCRQANDALARLVARSDRLHGVAVVPLQDPEAAAAELRRAVTDLGLRGVEIGTTMEHIPVDDRRFDPFFAAAAELGVPVMLHPYYVGTRPHLADFYMTNLTGNPMETCIAATSLILSGFFDRHPTLKLVLVHAGGFMPYQIGRLDHGFNVRAETRAVIAEHDVARFQIPVDDAAFVCGGQSIDQRHTDLEKLTKRHAAARNQLGERPAAHELHRDEGQAIGFLERVDRDDVRMIEGGDCLGFALESLAAFRV